MCLCLPRAAGGGPKPFGDTCRGTSPVMLLASLMIFMLAWVVVALQIHDDKHGFGSGYLGYGNNVRLNEVGGLGIASAGASEDSIELMVGPAATAAQHCTAQHSTSPCCAWQ